MKGGQGPGNDRPAILLLILTTTTCLMDTRPLIEKYASRFPDNTSVESNWYLIVATLLSPVMQMEAIKHIYSMMTQRIAQSMSDPGQRLQAKIKMVRRLREALLKGAFLTGMPRVLLVYATLNQAIKDQDLEVLERLPTEPVRRIVGSETDRYRQRGRNFFESIYDKHSEKVVDNLSSYNPDLGDIAIASVYGQVLSEDAIISLKDTCLIEFACCLIQDCEPQAKGHMFGCLNNGATSAEVARVKDLVFEMVHDAGIQLQRSSSAPWLHKLDQKL